MAVTYNCSLPSLLYRGGVVKSVNRLYIKQMADIIFAQTSFAKMKFVSTPESQYITAVGSRRARTGM